MPFPADQIDALRPYCEKISTFAERNVEYLRFLKLRLPDGCTPVVVDALLCPSECDGYPSRLFVAEEISCSYSRNWNVSDRRIGETNWKAVSWRITPEAKTLVEKLKAHLTAFARKE